MSAHPSSVRHRDRRSLTATDERGAGEPLVLLHGLGATRASLVSGPLAGRHRVITADLPGFGDSPPVGTGFDLNAVIDRLARALAACQVTAPPRPRRSPRPSTSAVTRWAAVALTLAARRPLMVSAG